MNILIVDDHAIFRSGLRSVLASRYSEVTVTEAVDGQEAIVRVDEIRPDLVLMDLHLGDEDGGEVARQILARLPLTKIIVILTDSDSLSVERALMADVSGYILKTSDPEELFLAIEAAFDGKCYVSPELNASVLDHYRRLPQEKSLELLFIKVLHALNEAQTLLAAGHRVVAAIKEETGLDAVGLRLRERNDAPYIATNGFSAAFVKTENSLTDRKSDSEICRDEKGHHCLECTCGLVLSGKADRGNPLFTRGGSAWTNEAKLLLDIPAEQDPRLHPRDRCIHEGFQSLALIPIRVGPDIVGLLQLNDRRKGCFTLKTIQCFEGIAACLGVALARQRAEQVLRETQKMAGIGHLAGGIAHEFNNLLAAMMLNLNLVQMGLPGNQAYELLGGMEDLCKRAGGLIKQLLALSSQSFMRLQPLDLVGWLSRQSNALRSNLEQSITLQVCCKGAELCVNADENLMGQVLLELLRNAQEAMKSGGKIGLLVEGVEVSDQQAAEQEGVQPGKHVCLSVTDSGCGMEQSTMERMFEPFFSTKDVGKGAGLGLAAVRGIIHQHHGWIEAESAVGKGSAFRIYLPAIPVPVTVPSTVSPRAPAEGRRTILVVEDDPMVLKMTRRFLAQTSHTILEATHATEALAVWATECNNIDLLYTDMVMPGGMTGLQLAQKMMAEKPGMKVIITSGYNTDLPDLHRILGSSIVYLPKPCNPAMLLSVIQKCLH